ncbi:MAG: sialate O-acetylesterase, partial [Bdellovibrionota bacterium]
MKTVVAAILLIHATGCRVVPLHALSTISGHAVLQAGKPFSIQGWATPGATVSALFRGQDYHAKVNSDSRWKIDFPPQSVGKGSDLILSTEREMQVFHDVAVGEVWVCSGQSNMEFHLGWTTHAQEDVATSADPDLRMFTVAHAIADSPARDVSGDWKVSGPEAAYDFSAACYFFGKELRRSLGVPVGLIHSAWGGAPAESWTTKETLAADTLLAPVLQPGAHPDDLPYPERRPVMLYNGMIAPLGATTIRGIAWYQG